MLKMSNWIKLCMEWLVRYWKGKLFFGKEQLKKHPVHCYCSVNTITCRLRETAWYPETEVSATSATESLPSWRGCLNATGQNGCWNTDRHTIKLVSVWKIFLKYLPPSERYFLKYLSPSERSFISRSLSWLYCRHLVDHVPELANRGGARVLRREVSK